MIAADPRCPTCGDTDEEHDDLNCTYIGRVQDANARFEAERSAPTPCPHRADVRDCDEWACVDASVAALRAQSREASR